MCTRRIRRLLAVFVCLIAGLLATGCGSSSSSGNGGGSTSGSTAQKSTGPITIGVANAKTGFMSAFDIPFSAGAQIAVDDINGSGGVLGRQLKLVSCDTKTDIAQGANCAQQVLDAGAAVLMSSCDYDYGGPGARVADQHNILAFACAASPKFGKQGVGENAFSIAAGTPTEGAMMAEYAYDKLKKRSAYLLRDTGLEYSKAFCQYFAERFKQLGGKVVGQDDFANDDQSIASQISTLRSASPAPDVIAYCSYPPGGASGLRQIRGAGIKLPIVADTAFDGNFWLKAVPNLSDFYYPTPGSIFGDDQQAKWQDFTKKYIAKEHSNPASANYPGSGYSSVELWADAVKKANSLDTAKVRAVLESSQLDVLNGPTKYGPDQHMALGRPMAVMTVRNGKNAFIERFTPAQVPQPQY
jgi:branched-chain amino acid transport system substrate-binding protein